MGESVRTLIAVITSLVLALPAHAATAQSSAEWSKRPEPIFTGQFIASDPAVIRDGALYRMFYTCWFPGEERFSAAICQATSDDGEHWANVQVDGAFEGVVLMGRDGEWDEHLEASFAVKRDGEYLLYYSGYRHEGVPAMGFPAALAVARSTDGVHFERVEDGPIIQPTPGWLDNDAVYSPAIIEHEDQLLMVYAGHCYTSCDAGYGVSLLSASSNDGIHWIKHTEPVLQAVAGIDWTRDGVAEPALVETDGDFYLFFTGLDGDARVIGIARSAEPFGPWEVAPDPIITPSPDGFDAGGVLAPDVRIEGDLARMWFLGVALDEVIAIGYAEAPFPFWRPD